MTRTVSAMLVMAALLCTGTSVNASGITPPAPIATQTMVTFRLQVSGDLPRDMTFWIAYGPLTGQFGIVRLQRSDPDHYATSVRLPAGRSSFAYIAGHGIRWMRYGPVPGDPIVTIRRLDRSTARQAARSTVSWHVPVG